MTSIKDIFKIGFGPSSSHTMGPKKAAKIFLDKNQNAKKYAVELYGSLALTGKGHLTEEAVKNVFKNKNIEIIWKPKKFLDFHPNGMIFYSYNSKNKIINSWEVYSIGGGDIADKNTKFKNKKIYKITSLTKLLKILDKSGQTIYDYVFENEDEELKDYLKLVWNKMKLSVKNGINKQGVLPGILHLQRRAYSFYNKAKLSKGIFKNKGLVFSYALGVSEENASGQEIVTAPTCGSSGVLPAVLYYAYKNLKYTEDNILNAIATAGLIGNFVKNNASISGAEVGCQGEIGTACAMASACLTQLLGGSNYQIEYAGEMGLEHHLGLTCDPVAGLVQIPCIERNAIAAGRSYDTANYVLFSDGRHRVSFDEIVKTMYETGKDLSDNYKETSLGGISKTLKYTVNSKK